MTTPAFRPDRPTPGSPWARHCPEAWPREWLVNGKMPPEFTRPATQDEADLITGRISEARFLYYTGKQSNPSPLPASTAAPSGTAPTRQSKRQRNRSERFAVLNAFVDFGIATAKLTPAEALVWLVLFRDTKADGIARTGQSDIARRTGLSVRGVQKAIDRLEAKGLIDVVQRGRLNVGPSAYRVRATPRDDSLTN